MTALTSAARSNVPMVVFAGEAPIGAKWYSQRIEQQPLAAACGAHYISAHSHTRMYQYVREAFHVARHERKPVVIGIPYDLQLQPLPGIGEYKPAADITPVIARIPPNPIRPRSRGQTGQSQMPDLHRWPRRRVVGRAEGS